jgi:hypothetical protein
MKPREMNTQTATPGALLLEHDWQVDGQRKYPRSRMESLRPSRRQVLRAILVGGIAVYLAPLGSRAYSALFADELLTVPDWNGRNGSLKYRVDATAKVLGRKVFARDIRAPDMPLMSASGIAEIATGLFNRAEQLRSPRPIFVRYLGWGRVAFMEARS